MNTHDFKQAAVIGPDALVTLMRAAGVERTYAVRDDIEQQVVEAVVECLADERLGIIILPEEWLDFIKDMGLQQRRQATPVVIGIPARDARDDVRAYYKSYTRQLLGIAIEI